MDSRVVTRIPKGRRLLQAAVATVVALGAPVALAGTADAATPTGKWDRIAQCESGGKWNTATVRRQGLAAQGQQGPADRRRRADPREAGLEGLARVLEEGRLPRLTAGQRTTTSVVSIVCRRTSATAWSGPLPAAVGAVSTTYTGRSTAT